MYFDAVIDDVGVVKFNGTPEEVRNWLLENTLNGYAEKYTVCIGKTVEMVSVDNYLARYGGVMPPLFESYQGKAMRLVEEYFNSRLHITGQNRLVPADVYVVWFSKTLQNWKALVSTTVEDGMYYEVTYDGEKKRAYLDAYEKIDNLTIPDGS